MTQTPHEIAGDADAPRPDARRERSRGSSQRRNRRGRDGFGVRVLILGWCLWLLGTWVVLWGMGGWTMPALRVMVVAALVGLMGVWPAVRLSQMTRRYPATDGRGRGQAGDVLPGEWARVCGATLVDWLCLNLVFQVVIWPLQFAARWTMGQAVWLDVSVAGWSLLTALLIAWGRGTDRPGFRSWAMVVCVGVVILEPALWWVGWQSGAVGLMEMRVSPLQAVWGVSVAGSPGQAEAAIAQHRLQIVSVAAAAVAGWVVLGILLWAAVRGERSGDGRRSV